MKELAIYIPALVCIIGAAMYLFLSDKYDRWRELGKHMFWVGLLVWLLGGVKLP